MNILIPDSWLRTYLDTNAKPHDIQKCLSLCGPSIERTEKVDGDVIYDIEITTNRPDCMSILGIAREASAILPGFGFKASLKSDPLTENPDLKTVTNVNYLNSKIDSKLCPRFTAILIRNVTVKPSPKEITDRLEKVGMRGLNNLVDVSNLLMHELGQPVHVFDYDRISGHTMILRTSRAGEKITTLDGKQHSLTGKDIVIEDGSGSLIDLCGIMGGQNSAVSESTKNVLLFVQTYTGSYIRQTSMKLAHRTSASALFEKNLPSEQVLPTLKYGVQLIKEHAGGEPDAKILDIYSDSQKESVITLPSPLTTLASNLMGTEVSPEQTSDILSSLGFIQQTQTKISVPFFRKNDITIPEDLVEEIARIYGYHNIPPRLMSGQLPPPDNDQTFYWENRIKTTLKYLGLNEIYTNSLVPKNSGLKLSNPLTSDWASLRTSLFPSHKEALEKNIGKSDRLNFFEIANVYLPKQNDLPEEQPRLIVSTLGGDYLHFKGVIESLLCDIGIDDFHPDIKTSDQMLYWEIPMKEILLLVTDHKSYTPISKFTPILEDVNVPHKKDYTVIIKQIRSVSPLITNIELIDTYKDKLTLRLTFHSDKKQLSSEDILPVRNQIAALFNISY